MRCLICDKLLSDFEATRKNVTTGEYIDICYTCSKHANIYSIDNYDLMDAEDEANINDTTGLDNDDY